MVLEDDLELTLVRGATRTLLQLAYIAKESHERAPFAFGDKETAPHFVKTKTFERDSDSRLLLAGPANF